MEWTTLEQKGRGLTHHVHANSDGKNKNKYANPTAERIDIQKNGVTAVFGDDSEYVCHLNIFFIHMLSVSMFIYLLHCCC